MRSFVIALFLTLVAALWALTVSTQISASDTPLAALDLISVTTWSLLGALALTTLAGLLTKRDLRTWAACSQLLLAVFFGTLLIGEGMDIAKWLFAYSGLLLFGIGYASRKPKAAK